MNFIDMIIFGCQMFFLPRNFFRCYNVGVVATIAFDVATLPLATDLIRCKRRYVIDMVVGPWQ
jgi:hypothetical protein